jgi:hypothetical protein
MINGCPTVNEINNLIIFKKKFKKNLKKLCTGIVEMQMQRWSSRTP